MWNFKSIGQGVRGYGSPKSGGFPLTLNVALSTVLRTNVLHCDNGPSTYWCHDLDLSRSRVVIGHVTNWSAISFPISVPLEPSLYLQQFSRYSAPKSRARARTHTHPPTKTPRHEPQVILYSVPRNVLHWTDNEELFERSKFTICKK